MKTRVRWTNRGFFIAAPGYGVDDGEQFLHFSPNAIALPIYLRGTIPVNQTGVDVGAPQPYNNQYRRMTVDFGKTFPVPPIVIFQSKWNDGVRYDLPTRASINSTILSGSRRTAFRPLFVEVTTTQIHLWNILANIESMSYLVLENTLT